MEMKKTVERFPFFACPSLSLSHTNAGSSLGLSSHVLFVTGLPCALEQVCATKWVLVVLGGPRLHDWGLWNGPGKTNTVHQTSGVSLRRTRAPTTLDQLDFVLLLESRRGYIISSRSRCEHYTHK
jgi:hypothetical protein